MPSIILSYKNFAKFIPGVIHALPSDRFVFLEEIPGEDNRADQQDQQVGQKSGGRIIVLIASPVECHLFAAYFTFPGFYTSGEICKNDLEMAQKKLCESFNPGLVKEWAETNIRIPFGIDIFQVSFPPDGIIRYQREGFELIFLRVGPEITDIHRNIWELTDYSQVGDQLAKATFPDVDTDQSTPVGGLICFPFSFLKEALDPTLFPRVKGWDHENLFLSKFCDYEQTYPVNHLSNNMKSIKMAFPNYVRKELFFGKVWFVDIPRTSSSSIKVELEKRYGLIFGKKNLTDQAFVSNQIIPNHIPAKFMRKMLGGDIWDHLFTFSFVRNPWDRMVSMYNYRKKLARNIPENMTFSEYIRLLYKDRGTGLFQYHGHYFSNADYLVGDDDEILVSFVGRYENRENDIKTIVEYTGIQDIGKISTQKSRETADPYCHYYNDESREIVADLFSRDLDIFGYTFEYHG